MKNRPLGRLLETRFADGTAERRILSDFRCAQQCTIGVPQSPECQFSPSSRLRSLGSLVSGESQMPKKRSANPVSPTAPMNVPFW